MIRAAFVTGGTGFVGSALVRRLVADGTGVTCLVRPGSPRTPPAGVRVVTLEQLGDVDADVAFNLASYGVKPGEVDPQQMIDGNVTLLARVVEAAQRWSLARLVHVGSCSEYAPADEPTLVTEDYPLAPTSLYGAGKAATTLFGTALARRLGVPMVTLRLFGTYGPGEAEHRLIPHLASRLLRGEQGEMTSGEQARDLAYVDDVVAACIAAAGVGTADYDVYNVCTGVPLRIREVAEMVARQLEQPVERLGIGRISMREGETKWLVGDPSRFRAATAWKPTISLEEGVRRSVAAVA